MSNKDALESAINQIRERLKEYEITDNERDRIEKVIELHRSRAESYEPVEWAGHAKKMYDYIQFSSRDIERRMELTEHELWTPFTI